MKNIFLVFKREYLVRVRKKSFILMTLLTPLLIAAFYGIMVWAAIGSFENELKSIQVIDKSGLFKTKFKNDDNTVFDFKDEPVATAQKKLKDQEDKLLVLIPADILQQPGGLQIYSDKSVSPLVKGRIERIVQQEIRNIKLTKAGITQAVIEDANQNVDAQTFNLDDEGKSQSSSTMAAYIAGYAAAFLLYIFILVYGAGVMQSVMEEKSSRIIEVIISSVKPFHLMLGKILGVAAVGLTQFLLWAVLTFGITTATQTLFGFNRFTAAQEVVDKQTQNADPELKKEMEKQQTGMVKQMNESMQSLQSLPLTQILLCFLFYFFGGYLLYSSLYAAIGASVENQQEAGQFMFPIMMPIIAAIFFAQLSINQPDGSLAFWTSMIPFTSPIVMMARIPFGVPGWEIALSMALLVLGFVGTTWLAARIYRVGILMYGKKVNYKELGKWIFYKG
ncbi:MAG: ABC transporter permease [Runella slithyformis]|jgi:ABC-2 type transport system permease protein|nr:MAG: ABC transporter permease [Runella slithyformis]TAF97881.1 MAG: ABC transporter permease [Runella sp.]TAG22017.1 MAG: ABC transporter permease [Cytophagales bacterium]TAG38956.1 MAG: ABC transporter permease [Cytophagia bacterium]TAF79889.1 MAG: ABC transporter permease [Runella slithyformis]